MKLLILTQKIDRKDPILGFFHRWIEEFSKHCESVIVICLQRGEYDLPKNVRILSLGKEEDNLRLFKIVRYVVRFYAYIWRERKNYNEIFVHMNPIYAILGGVFWRVWGKRIGLWYAHKHVDFKLRVAEKIAHSVFTPSARSFRLLSTKIKITGHGIDTDLFVPNKQAPTTFSVLSVGRIAPVKDYEILISAIEKLKAKGVSVPARIIGAPTTPKDHVYVEHLRTLIKNSGLSSLVSISAPVLHTDLPRELCKSPIFVNMSKTGSLDKAVLEAMSSGIPVLTSNESFSAILGNDTNMLTFTDAESLADRIAGIRTLSEAQGDELSLRLRSIIVREHNLKNLVSKIISYYATS